MELAIGAMTKLFSAVGGLGQAAAPVTAAAAPAMNISSVVLNALQGVSAVVQAVGLIGQGQAQADTLNQQASEATLQAGQEQVQAQQRQNSMRRELARVLGQNDVSYAAAGVDLTGGIAADQAANAKKAAATELSIDQQDTDFRRALYRQRAQGLRRQAGSVQTASMLSALGTAADFGVSLAKRGAA